MLNIILSKPNFFSIAIICTLMMAACLATADFDLGNEMIMISMGITIISLFVNMTSLRNNILLKNSNLNLILLALFYFIGLSSVLSITLSVSFLCISLAHLFYVRSQDNHDSLFYVLCSVFIFIANILFYPTFVFTVFFILYLLISTAGRINFIRFVVSYFMLFLLGVQVLYLTDNWSLLGDFADSVKISKNYTLSLNNYYLIPIFIFSVIAILDRVTNSFNYSLKKRNLWNFSLLLYILLIVGSAIFYENFDLLIIYFYFPLAVIIGRFLQYIRISWLQLTTVVLVIFSFIIYKMHEIILYYL